MSWIERDISFCDFKKCGKKDTCHRYEEKHETGDSVFIFQDDYDWKNCKYHWKEEK